MDLISENPYRTLGVFCGASTREIQKQLAKVKAFSRVGKQSRLETDFEFLGGVNRDLDLITEAANKIEQAKNKVMYSLFWFQKANHIDETALGYLVKNETDKAIEIWSKLIDPINHKVSVKNFSAYLNLSTILIALGFQDNDKETFISGFQYKGILIGSDHFGEFVKSVGGENIVLNKDFIANEILSEVIALTKKKSVDLSYTDILEAFKTFPPKVLEDLKKKYTEQPIQSIEKEIEFAQEKREDYPEDANEYGTDLYKNTKQNLQFLIQTLGKTNIEVKTLANNLANEMLQCSIDFFNSHQDDEDFDPGEEAVKLAKMAKSICPPGATLNRINENLETIQQWVNDKPKREKQGVVKSEYDFITKQLAEFQDENDALNTAKQLIISCKEKLSIIKERLGENDIHYLEISTAVANNAQGMAIVVVNDAMEKRNNYVKYLNYQNDPMRFLNRPSVGPYGRDNLLAGFLSNAEAPYAPEYSLEKLKYIVKEAWGVIKLIGSLDMLQEQMNNYNKNRAAIKSIAEQLNIPTNVGQHIQKATGWCYIATMAYGDYNHPQVIVLRNYRDEVLLSNLAGKIFVRLYYSVSPTLVKVLKNNKFINTGIRNILNRIIIKIQK